MGWSVIEHWARLYMNGCVAIEWQWKWSAIAIAIDIGSMAMLIRYHIMFAHTLDNTADSKAFRYSAKWAKTWRNNKRNESKYVCVGRVMPY